MVPVLGDPTGLDKHLIDNYSIFSDAMDQDQIKKSASGADAEATKEAGVAMDEESWFRAQLDSDVAQWRKLSQEFNLKAEQLKGKEEEFEHRARTNVAEASKGFTEKYLQLLPFKANDDAFELGLSSAVEARVEQIAKLVGCDPGDAACLGSPDNA